MKTAYRSAMEALYLVCAIIAGSAIVIMTLSIPYGVFMRYVVNAAASWPEPLAVQMMILFTFIGGAACYRASIHIAVKMFVDQLPDAGRRLTEWLVTGLVVLLCLFMIIWGTALVQITWNQVIAELPWVWVGLSYMPIPIGGAITILFIIELVWLGPPGPESVMYREPTSN
ncbi:TRAP transporter small permease [Xanthobacteraceae bacterium Astr-EGSB]|uniref:TRAP transporter small permease n=1 Tax=Astrobacterium formosum TaxID=3069710 RepID=UPI0027B402E5|nr:TRAP transporter small permease [Xanthobacteraceae bacterium Astr-EGSB]